jgi:hypothetical protein
LDLYRIHIGAVENPTIMKNIGTIKASRCILGCFCVAIAAYNEHTRHTDRGDHGPKEKDRKDDDHAKTYFRNEPILKKVLPQRDECGEVGRRRQCADVEDQNEVCTLCFKGVLTHLRIRVVRFLTKLSQLLSGRRTALHSR